jgi:hypothetical protein
MFPTSFFVRLHFHGAGVDVAIDFYIGARCPDIDHALFPLASGGNECRNASGEQQSDS